MKKALVSSFSPNVIGEGIELVYESIIQYCRFTISTAEVDLLGRELKGCIIIYLCTETQHYCLLTEGAVKIKSAHFGFGAQHKTILIVIQTILMQFL